MNKASYEVFAELLNLEEGRKELQQFVQSLGNDCYDDFLNSLYLKLDDIVEKIECSRDKYFSHDEDAITSVIAGRLEEAGYTATEQTKKNGSVDLTVTLGKHKWIAEAKIAYSNSKILEGLLQLLTRYVTRDKHCGLLIYIKKNKSKNAVDEWERFIKNEVNIASFISKKNSEVRGDIKCVLDGVTTNRFNNLSLCSTHTLVSGSTIVVRHFCADLYHNPTDASGNKNRTQRIDNAMNNLANLYFEHIEKESEFDSGKCLELLERLFRDKDPDDFLAD